MKKKCNKGFNRESARRQRNFSSDSTNNGGSNFRGKKQKMFDFLRFWQISNGSNFLTIWSWEKLLVPRSMYSARSVDSRGFFCFSMMAGYPTEARKMAYKNLENILFLKSGICFEIIRHLPGLGRVPYHFELTEKSTGINRSRGVDIPRYQ